MTVVFNIESTEGLRYRQNFACTMFIFRVRKSTASLRFLNGSIAKQTYKTLAYMTALNKTSRLFEKDAT